MDEIEEFGTYPDTAGAEIPASSLDTLKEKMEGKKFQWYGDKYFDIIDFEYDLDHEHAFLVQSGMYTDKQLHYMFGDISDFHRLLEFILLQKTQAVLLAEKMKTAGQLNKIREKEHNYIG